MNRILRRRGASAITQGPRSRRRVSSSLVAGALGVVLLTSGAGTYARWSDSENVSAESLSAGSVDLTLDGQPTIQLVSRQPVGSRTYASTQTCPVPAGYVECRVVSTTLPEERLIVGDGIFLRQIATLTASGQNLRGNVVVDTRDVLISGSSALGDAATVRATVTDPAGTTSELTGGRGTFDVNVATGTGLGAYSVLAAVTVPPSNGGARWGPALRAQILDLDSLTVSFVQTR